MKYSLEEVENLVNKDLPLWKIDNAQAEILKIKKVFKFENFMEAINFLNQAAIIIEENNHHPTIFIDYNKVELTFWSHDVFGITDRDLKLAKALDSIF